MHTGTRNVPSRSRFGTRIVLSVNAIATATAAHSSPPTSSVTSHRYRGNDSGANGRYTIWTRGIDAAGNVEPKNRRRNLLVVRIPTRR